MAHRRARQHGVSSRNGASTHPRASARARARATASATKAGPGSKRSLATAHSTLLIACGEVEAGSIRCAHSTRRAKMAGSGLFHSTASAHKPLETAWRAACLSAMTTQRHNTATCLHVKVARVRGEQRRCTLQRLVSWAIIHAREGPQHDGKLMRFELLQHRVASGPCDVREARHAGFEAGAAARVEQLHQLLALESGCARQRSSDNDVQHVAVSCRASVWAALALLCTASSHLLAELPARRTYAHAALPRAWA